MPKSIVNAKPVQRENFSHPTETTTHKRTVASRMALDRETKRAIVRCILGLGKGLEYTQSATRVNGRVIHQDAILQTVIEHIADQQQAEMERVRIEADRRVQTYRRAMLEVRGAA